MLRLNVQSQANVRYLGMPQLQAEAAANIEIRKQELDRCGAILDEAMDDFRTFGASARN